MRGPGFVAVLLTAASVALSGTLTGAQARAEASISDPSPPLQWGRTVAVSAGGSYQAPVLLAAPGRNRTEVAGWWRSLYGETGTLLVSVKRPGRPWSTPVKVGRGEVQWAPEDPWLAVDGSGGVTAVYSFGDTVFARYKPPRHRWRPRTVVHSGPPFPAGVTPLTPAVWVNRAGAAMVTWEWCKWGEPDFGNCFKYAAYRTAAGHWLRATRLEHERWPNGGGEVTIDRHGTAMRYAPVPAVHAVTVRTYRPGHGWGRPTRLARPWRFRVASNAAGDQVFMSKGGGRIKVRTKSPGQPWSARTLLGLTIRGDYSESDWAAGPAVDSRGRATIAYRDRLRGNALSVVQSDAKGAWSTPRALTGDAVSVRSFSVSTDAAGHRVVAWVTAAGDPTQPIVWVAYRVPGARWSHTAPLTGPSTHAVVGVLAAVRSDGVPVVGWRGNQGAEPRDWRRYRVRSAVPPK